jgi:LCP family protein required for cell wall assembly
MPEKKRVNWKRIVIISVCVLLSLILLAVATVGIYATYLMNKISRNPANESKLTPSEVDQILQSDPDNQPMDPSESLPIINDTPLPSDPIPPVEAPKHIINILLIGQDETSGNHRARSDSMILVTCNTKSKSITFTSFMRDSYVQIPGYPANKLNHAYQYGGMSLLCDTLRVNFGVEIDGAVEINFSSFQEIIDMLGGVDISLTEKEVKHMNNGTKWGLKVGNNRLNGEQALAYARIREIDSDYQRTERQRTVLMALVAAYKNQPISTMLDLLDDIMPLLSTNMTNDQIWGYSMKVVTMVAGAKYTSQRIPADGTFSQGNAQVRPGLKAWFQYNIDFEANRELLRKIIEE